MTFLITRPEHENTVFYLSQWSNELIEQAKNKGIKVLDCHRERAQKKIVQEMISKHQPKLIMFNGHGSRSMVCGHQDAPLVKKNDNEKILKGTIVYARACQTAAELGPACIEQGTRAYIGYQEDFAFWTNNYSTAHPLKDVQAQPSFKPSNQVIRSLLNGATAEEAYNRSQAVSDEEIERLMQSDAPPEAEFILPLLLWNKHNQSLLGDKEANI